MINVIQSDDEMLIVSVDKPTVITWEKDKDHLTIIEAAETVRKFRKQPPPTEGSDE